MELKRYCGRFPSVLRDAFMNEKDEVKQSVQYIYKAVKAYRAIDVNANKKNITQQDFESHVERKLREGKFKSLPKGLTLYSCSCFFT